MVFDQGWVKVIICPKDNPAKGLEDIDVIHLKITNARGHKNELICTPDEALDISTMLASAASVWLNYKYAPYIKDFGVRRNQLTKSLPSPKAKGRKPKK